MAGGGFAQAEADASRRARAVPCSVRCPSVTLTAGGRAMRRARAAVLGVEAQAASAKATQQQRLRRRVRIANTVSRVDRPAISDRPFRAASDEPDGRARRPPRGSGARRVRRAKGRSRIPAGSVRRRCAWLQEARQRNPPGATKRCREAGELAIAARAGLQILLRAHEGRRIAGDDVEALVGGRQFFQLHQHVAAAELGCDRSRSCARAVLAARVERALRGVE